MTLFQSCSSFLISNNLLNSFFFPHPSSLSFTLLIRTSTGFFHFLKFTTCFISFYAQLSFPFPDDPMYPFLLLYFWFIFLASDFPSIFGDSDAIIPLSAVLLLTLSHFYLKYFPFRMISFVSLEFLLLFSFFYVLLIFPNLPTFSFVDTFFFSSPFPISVFYHPISFQFPFMILCYSTSFLRFLLAFSVFFSIIFCVFLQLVYNSLFSFNHLPSHFLLLLFLRTYPHFDQVIITSYINFSFKNLAGIVELICTIHME